MEHFFNEWDMYSVIKQLNKLKLNLWLTLLYIH